MTRNIRLFVVACVLFVIAGGAHALPSTRPAVAQGVGVLRAAWEWALSLVTNAPSPSKGIRAQERGGATTESHGTGSGAGGDSTEAGGMYDPNGLK